MTHSEAHTPLDWEKRFQTGDAPWERGGVHPAVGHFTNAGLLASGLRVYVPGCGRAEEPAALAAAGAHVTASDAAPSAAAFQTDRLKAYETARIIEADSLAWRPETPFDALYEQTFLCAIHPHDRARYALMAHDVLEPGGRLLALFMQKAEPGGPPYGCSLEAMRALFPAERWIWPADDAFIPFPHPGLGGKAELGGVLVRR